MPSRINMGPDGGPYIAINENNGNIELEDNTGTTVAIWDDANSQWDFQNNPISNVDSLTSNSVNTEELVNGAILAANKDGADADARLDAALSDADDGDKILLEAAAYDADRSIGNTHKLVGVTENGNVGTQINGIWTISSPDSVVKTFNLSNTMNLDGPSPVVKNVAAGGGGSIVVSVDEARLSHIRRGAVTFESGTSVGIIDSSTGVGVTDNGTNTVGDIA